MECSNLKISNKGFCLSNLKTDICGNIMDESVPAPSTLIKDGWIIECSDYHVGCSQTFRIDELLYHEKSEFQDIVVIKK